jgi:hypothetical protein
LKAEREYQARAGVIWAALAGYVALVIVGALNHEMWRDEVRALSFAKGAESWSSLVSQLPGEGHPILWYAVLRLGFALTHSNFVLPIAAIAAATVAAYVILRYAPFPLWLRLLAIFGAFLGSELSVSPRNYGIGVMLMLLACIAFRHRRDRPIVLGLVLFLLANTSIHAALATLVILLYWAVELSEPDTVSTLRKPLNLAGFALAFAGVVVAIIVSNPTPDLAWAVSLSSLDYEKVLKSILMDPGKGLLGYKVTSIAAVGELPWRLVNIDSAIATRIIVDLCLAWLAWSLRRHRRPLIVLIVAVIGYQIFFRTIYTASLRHEGIVLFLIFAICWMETERANNSRMIALGLLPLFAIQALALPFLVLRGIRHAESSSKAYGEFIEKNPQYSNAVLMSEPDYLMESMPYYASNPIFMPRQGEFVDRVYFGLNGRRKADLTLGELMTIADGVACTSRRPVLLAIGYPTFQFVPYGTGSPLYRGLTFSWAISDWVRLGARSPVAVFPRATSDEIYRVYALRCILG